MWIRLVDRGHQLRVSHVPCHLGTEGILTENPQPLQAYLVLKLLIHVLYVHEVLTL